MRLWSGLATMGVAARSQARPRLCEEALCPEEGEGGTALSRVGSSSS